MKAISIKQPWCEEIMRGIKTREYRTWSTEYRGTLAVCSSLREDPDYHGVTFRTDAEMDALPRGEVVGLVEVVGVELAQFDLFAWVLANPRRVAPGLKIKGQLGLFNLTPELSAEVWQAVQS